MKKKTHIAPLNIIRKVDVLLFILFILSLKKRITKEASSERLGNPTFLAPDHPGFWRHVAPSAARPLQRVLGGVQTYNPELPDA